MAHAFNQISMHPDSIPCTSAVYKEGHVEYMYVRLSFGIKGAPHKLQQAMDRVPREIKGISCYLDDVRIFGKSFSEFLEALREFFKRMRAVGFKLKSSKCECLTSSTVFLGFLVDENGIRPNPGKVEALTKAEVKSAEDVESFLGVAGFFAGSVPGFAHRAAPLFAVKEKKEKKAGFVLTEGMKAAVKDLTTALTTAPVCIP